MKKILSLMMLLLLTACTEEVMQELQSNTYNPNLTISFWNQQIKENSELWQQALPYCQANPMKVNCEAVRKAWVQYNIRQRAAANTANNSSPAPLLRSIIRQRVLSNNS